eukprot:118794-Chlamydomonas_euryale.AAC.1
MAAAANMDDAREKAAHVLALFEKAVAAKQGDARPQDHAVSVYACARSEVWEDVHGVRVGGRGATRV